jgi:hypothetical protein
MAGYSGTPLPKKLGIKDGARLLLVGEPVDFGDTLGEMPGIVALAQDGDKADVIVCFVDDPPDVSARLEELKPRLEWTGGLWFAWRKRRPGFTPTLDENTVRHAGLAAGLVDNKVCAIDEEWSGLRFVWRIEDRPGRGKFVRRVP